MFYSARIKLTAWYLLIIMLISVSFSLAVYKILTLELDRIETMQKIRIEHRLPERFRLAPPSDMNNEFPRSSLLDPNVIEETKSRIAITLMIINLIILAFSAGSGYFLAGRTLKPIKEMVDEQNRFITDASHELRTPLTALKSEIEVNLRDKKLTLDNAKKILSSNLEEVNNLQILSDNLIKLAQYKKGVNNFLFDNLSLASVIKEAIKKVSYLAKNKNIVILNKSKDYNISGNKQALIELFVIFLDNAVKYSPGKTKIILSSEKTDKHILVQIKDQGIGIAKEDLPHLFDRFFRADKSRAKSGVLGYGLGLSIAKQILDKHQGVINIESKENKGTTFTIKIPIKHT